MSIFHQRSHTTSIYCSSAILLREPKHGGKLTVSFRSHYHLKTTLPPVLQTLFYSNVYLFDRNDKGGRIMLFVQDNLIIFSVSGFCFSEKKKKIFCVELNLKKQKWLRFCCHNPHKHVIKDHLQQIKNAIDFYSASYENIILYIYIFYSNIYKNIVFFCLSLSQHYISLKILQKKKKNQQKTKKNIGWKKLCILHYICLLFYTYLYNFGVNITAPSIKKQHVFLLRNDNLYSIYTFQIKSSVI